MDKRQNTERKMTKQYRSKKKFKTNTTSYTPPVTFPSITPTYVPSSSAEPTTMASPRTTISIPSIPTVSTTIPSSNTNMPSSATSAPTPPASDTSIPSSVSPTESGSNALSHVKGPSSRPIIKKRLVIRGLEFEDQLQVSHRISSIIKSHYIEPWTSWTKIPKSDRDYWFKEFGNFYTWKKEETYAIRKLWETRAGNVMRSLMANVRKHRNMPSWIGIGIWPELEEKWDDPKYKSSGTTNSNNRSSDCDGRGYTQYHGGNVSVLTHRDKMKKETGEDPGVAGVFKKLNSKTTEEGEEVWHNTYLRDQYNIYMEKKKWADTQSNNASNDDNDDSSTSDDELPDEYALWLEATGGCNPKGRMPGFGGEAKFIKQGCASSSSSVTEDQLKSVISNLVKEVAELKKAQQFSQTPGNYPQMSFPPPGFYYPPNPALSVPPSYYPQISIPTPNSVAQDQPFSQPAYYPQMSFPTTNPAPQTFTSLLSNKHPIHVSLSGEHDNNEDDPEVDTTDEE